MNSTAKTAELLNLTVEAEAALAGAQREQGKADRKADRAALKVAVQRGRRNDAVKALRAAQRAGKGVNAAARRVEIQDRQVATRIEEARDAKAAARDARRAVRTAERRLNRISLRAATAGARTVGRIAERLGKTSLAKTPAADITLSAEELPAVDEIEQRADEFAALDADAKAKAKQADALKKWLRQLPVGAYGRVTIARTPGGTVIDGDQVAIDYLDAGLGAPPRKGRKDTFKVLVAAALTPAVVDVTALPIAA
jgi:hypothetical protein